jgi:hypothetical protein
VAGTTVSTLTWSNNGVACQWQGSDSLTGTWNPVATLPVTNGDWVSVVTTNAPQHSSSASWPTKRVPPALASA